MCKRVGNLSSLQAVNHPLASAFRSSISPLSVIISAGSFATVRCWYTGAVANNLWIDAEGVASHDFKTEKNITHVAWRILLIRSSVKDVANAFYHLRNERLMWPENNGNDELDSDTQSDGRRSKIVFFRQEFLFGVNSECLCIVFMLKIEAANCVFAVTENDRPKKKKKLSVQITNNLGQKIVISTSVLCT